MGKPQMKSELELENVTYSSAKIDVYACTLTGFETSAACPVSNMSVSLWVSIPHSVTKEMVVIGKLHLVFTSRPWWNSYQLTQAQTWITNLLPEGMKLEDVEKSSGIELYNTHKVALGRLVRKLDKVNPGHLQ